MSRENKKNWTKKKNTVNKKFRDNKKSREVPENNRDDRYYMTHACMESFTCQTCGRTVEPEGAGSDHRNHCPHCLSSLHLDNEPGDRASECHGEMEAIGVWVRNSGEWALIHRCLRCGKLGSNRIAADDDPMKLMALALRPFTSPEISKEGLKNMTKTMEQ